MEIKYEVLEKELNTKELKPIYLLYGNDPYLMDSIFKKIKKKFGELVVGINYVIMDEMNVTDLIFNLQIPAFGFDKKLVVVKNSGLFKKDGRKKEPTPLQKEIITYIEENAEQIEEMAVLVFLEDEVDKTQMYQTIEKNGIICLVNELKPAQLIQKLKQVCQLYKVNVAESTLNYLLEIAGTNLQILMNEIRKLIEYAGEGGAITIEAIDLLAIKQMESVIFDLTDNLGNKKIEQALQVLNQLLYQKEPIQKILVTLYHHFKKLYFCSIALELNQDVVSALNLKPNQTFLVGKYKKQVSYFKKDTLKQILQEFVRIDEQSKNGLVDGDIALRSVLCNYCS